MAGGGGALQKLLGKYKDKAWLGLPRNMRKAWLLQKLVRESSTWHSLCVKKNEKIRWFHQNVIDKLKPMQHNEYATVDYKRQIVRGTFVEGRDMYSPEGIVEHRLKNIEQPYNDYEEKERSKYKYQNLKFYLLGAILFSLYQSKSQKRPIAWCSDQETPIPPHYPFWVKSVLHGHDVASVRRGFEVYKTVCATCHSMKFFKFRHLTNDIYPESAVKKIAANYDVEDGPNDKGEMYTRPGVPTDSFPSPYPNDETAAYANGGAVPPDLSNISSARKYGPDYLMALLTGYHDPPAGVQLRPGIYWNMWIPGNTIAMPPPLIDDMIEYEDGTPCNVSQMAKDVCNFFIWSAEPAHDERKLFALKATCYGLIGLAGVAMWYRFFLTSVVTRRIDFLKV